jgi:hypothetical protein
MKDPKYQHGSSESGWMEQNDTPRTDAAEPQLHSNVGGWVRADFARELERELAASQAEVERLKRLLSDLLILTEKNYWNSHNYNQIKEAINHTDK